MCNKLGVRTSFQDRLSYIAFLLSEWPFASAPLSCLIALMTGRVSFFIRAEVAKIP